MPITSHQKLRMLLGKSAFGELSVCLVCLPQNFLRLFSCQALLSPASELAQLLVLLVRVHWEEQILINQKLTKAGVARGPSGEGSLTFWSKTARRPHYWATDKSAPPPGGFFLGFPMKWMLLLVLVVIGVGTLMGTTATPVM